jgi:hypothetical protein
VIPREAQLADRGEGDIVTSRYAGTRNDLTYVPTHGVIRSLLSHFQT